MSDMNSVNKIPQLSQAEAEYEAYIESQRVHRAILARGFYAERKLMNAAIATAAKQSFQKKEI